MHQVHVDGHEKTSAQALRMGSVSLPVYALKDQWGAYVHLLITVPNVRLATTCGHIYLDFVETYQRELYLYEPDSTIEIV